LLLDFARGRRGLFGTGGLSEPVAAPIPILALSRDESPPTYITSIISSPFRELFKSLFL